MKLKNGLYLKEYENGYFYIYIVKNGQCRHSNAGSNFGDCEHFNPEGYLSSLELEEALKETSRVKVTYIGGLDE